VVFGCGDAAGAELEKAVEAAIAQHVGRAFPVMVRSVQTLAQLLRTDPYARYGLPAGAERVVSFLREARAPKVPLPLTEGAATVMHQIGTEVFTAHLPSPEGPVFMKLIERAYGTDVTTRTWGTLEKCAR
jgi:uncharacterized protein (DUF1697 family)